MPARFARHAGSAHYDRDSPGAGTAVVLIHMLNPWGAAWQRRHNEDNIDLNRSFVDGGLNRRSMRLTKKSSLTGSWTRSTVRIPDRHGIGITDLSERCRRGSRLPQHCSGTVCAARWFQLRGPVADVVSNHSEQNTDCAVDSAKANRAGRFTYRSRPFRIRDGAVPGASR